jgi:6-phosphogluconolactonase
MIHISKDADELNVEFANWLVQYIHEVLQQKNRFTIVLSGGNTPKKLYTLLATEAYKNKIDWQKLHFFWGDERYLPLEDERNNANMSLHTLLTHVPVNKEQIHIMETDIPVEVSVHEYEKILHQYFVKEDAETFDLVLLGLGDNGHTLSLFPHEAVVFEKQKWVSSFWLAEQGMYRITLTAPVVNKASKIVFLVTGENKASMVQTILHGKYHPELYPAQLIQPEHGELHWFLDEAAASV